MKLFKKFNLPKWLIVLLVTIFVFRIPSFFEPFSYGDEMIYLTLGHAVKKGLILYRDIHDNKPPLLYLTAAITGNVFWFRSLLAFWMLATTIMFWKLLKTLFTNNKKLIIISTWIFAIFTTIPLLEGQTANAELFMVGLSISALLILFSKKNTTKNLLIAGSLFSLATLFKIPAAFDLPVIIIYWFITSPTTKKDFIKLIKKSTILSVGFAVPITLSILWYFLRGAGSQYLIAAFGQNLGYLSSFRPGDVVEPFFVRNGPLLTRASLVLFGSLILFIFRKKLSKNFILASTWLLLSLFAVTLSERPYPHYLIQSVPPAAILVGFLITSKVKEQVYSILLLSLLFITPVYYNFWHYPSLPYYVRFVNFATGKISKQQYFSLFEGNVSRNYKISQFISNSSSPNDRIFVWGSSSTIYALSRRLPPVKYTTNYHINDFSSPEKILVQIQKSKPIYVVILPGSPPFPLLASFLQANYILVNTIDNALIWHLVDSNLPIK